MSKKMGTAAVLVALTAILAAVSALLYTSVMYRFHAVYYILVGAIVVAVAGIVFASRMPRFANYIPVILAVLMASAAIWGTHLMVNQIAYVIVGLDGVGTIMSYIGFAGCALAGMILSIVASFMPMAKTAV